MLAACLLFKDSASYLDEWLLFHFAQGFRRFYLYDNESSDDWHSVLEPWIAAGLATVTAFPGVAIQQTAYNHCLARARGEVDWLAFIDDDEFLFAPGDRSLGEELATFERHAGVAVSWRLFGSGGAERRRPGGVLERFTACCANPADQHVKCIVQPHRVICSALIGHAFVPLPGSSIVDENGLPLSEPLNSRPSATRLRINHYLVKSWEEWSARRSRPQADTGRLTPHSESAWRAWDREWSVCRDIAILRHLPAMLEARWRLETHRRAPAAGIGVPALCR